uniref:Uncharacterized protein n=1 Tax=Meloidogyne enterolobii TaxID=390850 RepID=A0A6V7XV03_MELEN|nr:unnamed protein product [Meloidogyne enterolobii]
MIYKNKLFFIFLLFQITKIVELAHKNTNQKVGEVEKHNISEKIVGQIKDALKDCEKFINDEATIIEQNKIPKRALIRSDKLGEKSTNQNKANEKMNVFKKIKNELESLSKMMPIRNSLGNYVHIFL